MISTSGLEMLTEKSISVLTFIKYAYLFLPVQYQLMTNIETKLSK